MNIDFYFFQQINQFAGEILWLDKSAIFFAEYFGYILFFSLTLFLIRNFKKYWPMVVLVVAGAVIARFVITEIIRWLWERPRPFVENNVNLLLTHTNTSSFPSGHATLCFTISTIIYFYNKKAGIGFLVASFLISISRVFCGIHWPSDIIAGAAIGIFSGWLIMKILAQHRTSSGAGFKK